MINLAKKSNWTFVLLLAALAKSDSFDARLANNASQAPGPINIEKMSSPPPQLALGISSIASNPQNIRLDEERLIRQLFRDAKFEEALRLSQQQLNIPDLPESYKSWLKEQVPTLKLGLAWQWIRSGKCDDALEILTTLTQNIQSALAWKGLGFCSLKKKDYFSAQEYLQKYLFLKGQDPEAYILLAEAEEALGSYETALELTQKANALTNLRDEEKDDLEIRESKLAAKVDESPTQVDINSGFFTLRYQSKEHQHLVQPSLNILQSQVQFLVQNLGFEYPVQAIEVIFHPHDNFSKANHGPKWAAAIYDGKIRLPIRENQTVDENFAKILRHELTHAMLSEQSKYQAIPHWFQEGLAQYCECAGFCQRYTFAASSQKFLDERVFEQDFSSLSDRDAGVAYRQSLYLLLTLAQGSQYYGLPGLKQIIQNLPTLESHQSNAILRQVGIDFPQLHSNASRLWDQQISF